MLSYSIGKDSITLFIDGELANVDSSHRNYSKLREELLKPDAEQDLERIKMLSSIQAMLKQFQGGVEISDSDMKFEGKSVNGYIVDKILELIQEDGNVDPYVNFFLNLQNNPNKDVAGDLFKWCEHGKMPITPDGCIIAFKKVKADFTDCHTGKFDNSPGSILMMPREKCDGSRNNTCSTGFHFCSASYLGSFKGSKVVAVKVNPADVTAIPHDYNNAKGRCCRYEVVNELSNESAAKHDVWSKAVKDLEDPREFPEEFFTEQKTPKKKTTTKKDGEPKKKPVTKPKAEKSAAPKVVVKKIKATTAEAKSVTKQVKAAVKKATAKVEPVKEVITKAVAKAKEPKVAKPKAPPKTTQVATPFKNQNGEHWAPKIVASVKKDVEAKKITMKQAAHELITSPSTLHGWFKKV